MANSVETRYPFLDEDVIAFAACIHPRWKLRRGLKDKYLLRQAAARVLPEAVAQRPKAMLRGAARRDVPVESARLRARPDEPRGFGRGQAISTWGPWAATARPWRSAKAASSAISRA